MSEQDGGPNTPPATQDPLSWQEKVGQCLRYSAARFPYTTTALDGQDETRAPDPSWLEQVAVVVIQSLQGDTEESLGRLSLLVEVQPLDQAPKADTGTFRFPLSLLLASSLYEVLNPPIAAT